MSILSSLANLIIPRFCLVCNRAVLTQGFCGTCWNSIRFINGPGCARCGSEFAYGGCFDALCGNCMTTKYYIDYIYSPLRYNYIIKPCILRYKNAGEIELADFFSNLISPKIPDSLFDLIVAVPLHTLRLIWRGYNQSEILASKLSASLNVPHVPNLLKRIRFTTSQGKLNKNNRIENVKHAFSITEDYSVKNLTILLVDDVYTTGSTMEECAKILKHAGARSVHAAIIAKT